MDEDRDLYRTLVENSPDAICVLDANGKIIYSNLQTAVLFGLSGINNIDEMDIRKFLVPADCPRAMEYITKILKGEKTCKAEYHFIRNDGTRLTGETTAALIKIENQAPAVLLIIKNINDRKQSEEKLRRSASFHESEDITTRNRNFAEHSTSEEALKVASAYNRRLIEISLDPLVTIGPDGKITDVNTATETVTGYSRNELIGTDFADYFTEPEKARTGYKKVFKKGFVRDYSLEIQHRNGSITPVLYNASVYQDNSGNVIGVFAAARDITDLKKAEEAIKAAADYNRNLIDISPDPLVTIGPDGKITDVNTATETTTGINRNELIGTDFADYFTEPDKAQAGYKQVFEKGLVRDYPLEIRHRNGSITAVLYNASVYRNKNWDVVGVFAAARDITKRKMVEAELNKYREHLE